MLIRLFLLIGLTGMLSACKLAVIVVEGGEVQSAAHGTCGSGAVCVHSVTDFTFSDTFTAVPAAGWYFTGWVAGNGFLCDQEPTADCVLSNVGLGGIPIVQAVVNSNEVFRLLPSFQQATPITDTVTIDGLEWAQPDLFLDVALADIAAACPAGACPVNAVLNGHNLTGWTWATLSDVGGLFQATTPHPGGEAIFEEIFTGVFVWADDFMDVVGFRATYDFVDATTIFNARGVVGYTSSAADKKALVSRSNVGAEPYASADTRGNGTGLSVERSGAWFYRTAAP